MRITRKDLDAMVKRLNCIKGYNEPEYNTVGSYRLSFQNGYVSVVKVMTEGGGVQTVGGCCGMTTKECYYFLSGILANL